MATNDALADCAALIAKMKADLRTIKWMTAALLVLTSILFVRSFFFSA